MDRTRISLALTGADDFANRPTNMVGDRDLFWITRRERDTIGFVAEEKAVMHEWRLTRHDGTPLGLGPIRPFKRISNRQRHTPLLIGAQYGKAVVVFYPGQQKATLFRANDHFRDNLWLRATAVGIAADNHGWCNAVTKPFHAPLSVGWTAACARFEYRGDGKLQARVWTLPSFAPWINDFWFDRQDRVWFSLGVSSSYTGGGYSLGYGDLSSTDWTLYQLPYTSVGPWALMVPDHTDIAGDAQGAEKAWINWPFQWKVIKTTDIYGPGPAPIINKRIEEYEDMGNAHNLQLDQEGNLYFCREEGTGPAVGALHKMAPPQDIKMAEARSEPVSSFVAPVIKEPLNVEDLGEIEIPRTEDTLAGQVSSDGWRTHWPLDENATGLVLRDMQIWFLQPGANRLVGLLP